jgi:hypothetical protein
LVAEEPLAFEESLSRSGNTVKLTGDAVSPGASRYYGTNAASAKGFYPVAGSSLQTAAGNTPGTNGNVMSGIGGYITPGSSGKIFLTACGQLDNTGDFSTSAILRYGTGTLPAHGAALTGTPIGATASKGHTGPGVETPFSLSAVKTGLAIGTPYWISFSYGVGGGTGVAYAAAVCAFEFP